MRLFSSAVCLLACVGASAATVTSEEAWRVGWPALAGPQGSFAPLSTGVTLLDDLGRARLAWTSEPLFGTGKMGSGGWRDQTDAVRNLGESSVAGPASWAGPVIADNRVYIATFRPTKKTFPISSGFMLGQTVWKADPPLNLRMEAEDLVVALDAQTGKTLWTAAHPEALMLAAGKRGGFQVAPACGHGRIYSLGTIGMVRAHDGATGTLVWENDIGPAHAEKQQQRAAYRAKVEAGVMAMVNADGWCTSLLVADDTVVVPSFTKDGLLGFAAADGRKLWQVESVLPETATPTLWRHEGRTYVVGCSSAGVLTLIDAADGRVLWRQDGFGPNFTTLSLAGDLLILNVKPAKQNPAKGERSPGLPGAVRLSLAKASPLWTLPDEPSNAVPTWMDCCAMQRVLIDRDRVLLRSGLDGPMAEGEHRYQMLDLTTGRMLARHVQGDRESQKLGGLIYPIEDRLICRENASHSPTHGGRHPWIFWSAGPDGFRRRDDDRGLCGVDLIEQATAYSTLMETPIVDGRLFERTDTGSVVCYDLRDRPLAATWDLTLTPAQVGLTALTLPMRLWEDPDGRIRQGKAFPPDETAAGAIFGTYRTFARWEAFACPDLSPQEGRLAGTLPLNVGATAWPLDVELALGADGAVSGRWTRRTPAADAPTAMSGTATGHAARAERIFPTPWYKDRPLSTYGVNPPGTTTTIVTLTTALPGGKGGDLHLCLDHDGTSIVRAIASSMRYSQAWHEVDAAGLTLAEGRITGTAVVILHRDHYQTHRVADSGLAGSLVLDVTTEGTALKGSWQATWGIAHEATGRITGRRTTR